MATTEANKRYIAKHPERVKAQYDRWYAANREAHLARRRSKHKPTPRKRVSVETKRKDAIIRSRVNKYGISSETYDWMLKDQDGLCAICRKPEVVKSRSLAVDHNHTTGIVRGLLCQKCNMAVGLVGEDVLILSAMIAYLDLYNGRQ